MEKLYRYVPVWQCWVLLALFSLSQSSCMHPHQNDFIGKWQTKYSANHSGWVYGMEILADGTCHLCTFPLIDPTKHGEVNNGDFPWEMHGEHILIGAIGGQAPMVGSLEQANLIVNMDGQTFSFYRVSEYQWRSGNK